MAVSMIRQQKLTPLWKRESVTVTARLVPKYLFTTASIDVDIGGKLILASGGVNKVVGAQEHSFEHDGQTHLAEITWGVAKSNSFPVQLFLDGVLVFDSTVKISNWWLMYWPLLIALGVMWTGQHVGHSH